MVPRARLYTLSLMYKCFDCSTHRLQEIILGTRSSPLIGRLINTQPLISRCIGVPGVRSVVAGYLTYMRALWYGDMYTYITHDTHMVRPVTRYTARRPVHRHRHQWQQRWRCLSDNWQRIWIIRPIPRRKAIFVSTACWSICKKDLRKIRIMGNFV